MKQRIITAAIAILIFIPILVFSDTIVFPIAFALLTLIALYELFACVGMKNNMTTVPIYVAAGICMAIIWIFKGEVKFSLVLTRLFFILVFYMLATSVFSKGTLPLGDTAVALVMAFYIIYGFSSVLILRQAKTGQYLYLLIFLSAWLTDTGAYFTGVFFGKHKLIPDVSPKKTIEGAVGGVLTCVVTFLVFGFVVSRISELKPYYIWMAVSGALVSIVSMLGDLIASLVKRKYHIKDYGWVFPGHGGVLDRFDSVLATAPCIYLLSDIFPLFR